jgi:hypothetical protein
LKWFSANQGKQQQLKTTHYYIIMSALSLSQKTIDALRADVERVASGAAAQWVKKSATSPAKKAAYTGPDIYTAAFMAGLVNHYEAMLAKKQCTITEANAEIERLKHRLSETARIALKHKNVVKPEVKVEVIEDSDSDSDVVEVNMVVYNGVTYLRDSNSNVLYHPKSHEVIGMWNKDRGRVDAYPINHHEE